MSEFVVTYQKNVSECLFVVTLHYRGSAYDVYYCKSLNFVQYNLMLAVSLTQLPLVMLCSLKGSMVQAQYCSEWIELWYSMLVQFLCFKTISKWRYNLYLKHERLVLTQPNWFTRFITWWLYIPSSADHHRYPTSHLMVFSCTSLPTK